MQTERTVSMFSTKTFFLGKSRVCQLTVESGDLNRGDYDGNTISLGLNSAPECNSLNVTISECNEYIFISGYEIVRFTTEDKIIDFISNIGKSMVVFAIAVCWSKTHVILS